MPVDYTSPVGQVRLLIADLDEASFLIPDEQINGYLALNASSVRRAAASCLDAMATSEVLMSKVIKSQDLTTDGAKVAAELRAQAATLRAQADAEEAVEDDDSFFGFIPFEPGCGRLEGEEHRL